MEETEKDRVSKIILSNNSDKLVIYTGTRPF